MEEYNLFDFPLLSLDTQSEFLSNNDLFTATDTATNINFIEEGPRESEMIANSNLVEETPTSTEINANSHIDEGTRSNEMVASTTIIEEGPRICPLCGAVVKLFYMNFNEQLLMCENHECDFPFGHEDLVIIRDDAVVDFIEDLSTITSNSDRSKKNHSSTCSIISSSAWSEINKLNRESDSSHSDKSVVTTASEREEKIRKQLEAKEKRDQIIQHLHDIKQINAALKETKDCPKTNIKNQKWLSNMKSLEAMSRVKLLTKKEKDKLKEKEPQKAPDYRIAIGPSNDNSTSLKIEITNTMTT